MTLSERQTLDDTDWLIIKELQNEARLSFSELGRRVGLSSPAATERVRKLEDAGIIQGYGARIDTSKVGLPITAFIRMTISATEEPNVRSLIANQPEIIECHRVTGSDSFIIKVVVSSVIHLEALLNRLMHYGQLTTSIVLSSPLSGEPIKQSALKFV
ncbi:Lrp/AsnC family transcriptional regulator [Ktedonosporobacter rubrisoli]|uniref:Lrp/AsnC family transcriptional regulator n=1 Tax=Ktedonosporobacter rubrisoli TaxID=2509675 RepID=A0A4P6JZL5_KTERU|nr:Lrp/AsnC family transcriptional regulator [Ktedonosporobacter rubrisoli]QBD80932.1 Lrp/AsnC family transcriptional regulator [Ktedonosporobacter rubrisoli]